MTNDESEIIRACLRLVESFKEFRQTCVRDLEDNQEQTEEIIAYTKRTVKDILFLHNLSVQLTVLLNEKRKKGKARW